MTNDIYNKYNIDETKLTRNYVKNPLKKKYICINVECPNKEDLEYLYNDIGLSIKKLSEYFDCSPESIRKFLKRYKIKSVNKVNIQYLKNIDIQKLKRNYIKNPLQFQYNKSSKRPRLEIPHKEDIEYIYITLNFKRDEIVSFFNVSTTEFKNWLKKYNIKKDVSIYSERSLSKNHSNFADILLNKSKLIEYIQKNKITTRQSLSKIFSISLPTIYNYVNKYQIHYLLKGDNQSLPEKQLFEIIKTKFPNVIHQYRDKNRYPFNCDFYIPELDLFVEYQGNWTHGYSNKKDGFDCHCPFDSNNEEHIRCVEFLKNKNTAYYNKAIYDWTIRDVLKRNTAKQNNLNYLEFFNIEQFMDWFNNKLL